MQLPDSMSPLQPTPTRILQLVPRPPQQQGALRKELARANQGVHRCRYSDSCTGTLVKAHVLSKAWLDGDGDGLARAHQVLWFGHGHDFPEAVHKAVHAGNAHAEDMFRAQLAAFPCAVPTKAATVAKFCCREHDDLFRAEVDNRAGLWPHPSARALNLLFLRPLLRQLHQLEVECQVAHIPAFAPAWSPHLFGRLPKDPVANLIRARNRVRATVEGSTDRWAVDYVWRHIPGEPRLAAAMPSTFASDGSPWGLSVVPLADGHLVAFHFCTPVALGAGSPQ